MSRLRFNTQTDAQAAADSIHARMIAAVPEYAASSTAGHTTAWATPAQDRDLNGEPVGSDWFVSLDARCMPVLTAAELAVVEDQL